MPPFAARLNLERTEADGHTMSDENTEDDSREVPTSATEVPASDIEATIPASESTVRELISPDDVSEDDDTKEEAPGGANLVSAMANMADQLREANRISEGRERVIDRLHDENQKLKQGELQQVMLPVFRDLIRLYDDLKITAANYADRDGNEKTATELTCYRETVGDILYRYGVERIEVAVGESFNPKEHKAVATVPSSDSEQDRTVAKIIRDGFQTDIRVVRNVEVEVYRHAPPAASTAGQSQTASEAESENQEAQ